MQGLDSVWLRRGLIARALWPLTPLHAALLRVRRSAYRRGWLRAVRLPVPVIVVGNLIAGGAGKTPAVLCIVSLLRQAGWRPGIVSRGYGRRGDGLRHVGPDSDARDVGDEPLLLCLRSGAPVAVARERPAAALALLGAHPGVDIVVCDDGLQHLALARDISVIVFDERGTGNGWLLPAGPLREPLPSIAPPRSIVLYNARAPSTPLPGCTSRRGLAGAVALEDWWLGAPADMQTLRALAGTRLMAAAGIAQPQRFFAMLGEIGLDFERLALADHHDFTTLPWPAGTPDVLITEKDAVKLRPERLRAAAGNRATRVWVVTLDFDPEPAFRDALLDLLAWRGTR